MKPTKSLIGSEKANNLATLSSQERLNLRETMRQTEAMEWIRRYRKKVLEEGRGEAQYWWQQTIAEIAKKRGQKAADDLCQRMNEQKDKK
jgi:CRISPR/Cas system-associated protein Cas7 (RAMP superfamily)